MPADLSTITKHVRAEYDQLLPLLNYLKARLKFDTVQWIRNFGAKDELVFSTRIKTFDRTFEKIVHNKHIPLSPLPSLRSIVLSPQRPLTDLVGIRFVCFDPYQILELVEYFSTSEAFQVLYPEYHLSPQTDERLNIYSTLSQLNFKRITRQGREYEDVSFLLYYRHLVDLFFDSGKKRFESRVQKMLTASTIAKLRHLTAMRDSLDPDLAALISQFPIECQIVTATQHVYNRTHRPVYESEIQERGRLGDQLYANKEDLNTHLVALKGNLRLADNSLMKIHQLLGIRYEALPRVQFNTGYGLTGRLPQSMAACIVALRELDENVVPSVLKPDDSTRRRVDGLHLFFERVADLNDQMWKVIGSGSKTMNRNLLDLSDLESMDYEHIAYWTVQRLVLLQVCNILLFSNDSHVNQVVVKEMNKQVRRSANEPPVVRLNTEHELLERMFQKLSHTDHAIAQKLVDSEQGGIRGWQDGQIDPVTFSDPLVPWRYATFMYKNREYVAAQREIRVGLDIWSRIDSSKGVPFALPERILFYRRLFEYELCQELKLVQHDVNTLAGILEACGRVVACMDGWISTLARIRGETRDRVERARVTAYEALIRLCVISVSTGSVPREDVELPKLMREFDERLTEIENEGSDGRLNFRPWWLLANAAIGGSNSAERLANASARIKAIVHHPRERKQFDQICCDLLALWLGDNRNGSRRGFVLNSLNRLRETLNNTEDRGADGWHVVDHIIEEAVERMKKGQELGDRIREGWRRKLASMDYDPELNSGTNNVVAGLRLLLRF